MTQPSKHFNMQHPAVGSVACPVCLVARGVPCMLTSRSMYEGQRTETHVARVNLYQRTDEKYLTAVRGDMVKEGA